jgi:hypothetical protein
LLGSSCLMAIPWLAVFFCLLPFAFLNIFIINLIPKK